MDALESEMASIVLSSMFNCDVLVASFTRTVVAFLVVGAGYLICTKPDFADRDWDSVVAQLPQGLTIDYADSGWGVAPTCHLLDEGVDVFFAPYATVPAQRSVSTVIDTSCGSGKALAAMRRYLPGV